MMNKVRALIIDDEQLARQVIRNYLEEEAAIEIVGESENGFDGFKLINELHPELVFLDVMMPKLTGFEMLELVEQAPVIIFSTAYDEYAIKAFEKNAVDYLLKPYSKERFDEAVNKAKQKVMSQGRNSEEVEAVLADQQNHIDVLNRIAVRNGNKIHIVSLEKIHYLEAQDDYVKLVTEDGNFLKQQTMKYYEHHLPATEFLRIHRSYIVRLKEITKIEPFGKDTHLATLKDGTELSVSRSGYSRLKETLDI